MKMRSFLFGPILGLALLGNTVRGQEVLSYYAEIPQTETNWPLSSAMQLPGFDPRLGTLTQVELIFTGEIWESMYAENLGETSNASYHLTTRTWLSVTRAGSSVRLGNSGCSPVEIQKTGILGAYDGMMNFGGTSGVTYNNDIVFSRMLSDPDLAAYNGGTLVDFDASARACSSFSISGGNGIGGFSTSAQANLEVVYTYTPIPEPAMAGVLLGLAALVLAMHRRRDLA